MTQEQINKGRIAIAERCGWKRAKQFDYLEAYTPSNRGHFFYERDGVLKRDTELPDYHGSLDAIHEAEKVLTSKECVQYGDILRNKYGEGNEPAAYWHWHTTAPQRFEAMLRVLGAHPEDAR